MNKCWLITFAIIYSLLFISAIYYYIKGNQCYYYNSCYHYEDLELAGCSTSAPYNGSMYGWGSGFLFHFVITVVIIVTLIKTSDGRHE